MVVLRSGCGVANPKRTNRVRKRVPGTNSRYQFHLRTSSTCSHSKCADPLQLYSWREYPSTILIFFNLYLTFQSNRNIVHRVNHVIENSQRLDSPANLHTLIPDKPNPLTKLICNYIQVKRSTQQGEGPTSMHQYKSIRNFCNPCQQPRKEFFSNFQLLKIGGKKGRSFCQGQTKSAKQSQYRKGPKGGFCFLTFHITDNPL